MLPADGGDEYVSPSGVYVAKYKELDMRAPRKRKAKVRS